MFNQRFISIAVSLLALLGCQQSPDSAVSQQAINISEPKAEIVAANAQAVTLSRDQAKSTLSSIIPDITILSLKKSMIDGLWEVGFESRGKKGIIYLDESLTYVIAGNLVHIQSRKNLTEESFALINKVDLSLIPYEKALVIGDKKAKHRVAVFDDVD
jgi:thiol:disulfide interchange protein DsbC